MEKNRTFLSNGFGRQSGVGRGECPVFTAGLNFLGAIPPSCAGQSAFLFSRAGRAVKNLKAELINK